MKRTLAMLLTLVLCMGIAIPAHAGISIDVILSTLTEDELVTTVETAAELLKPYGYSIVIQKDDDTKETQQAIASNDENEKIDTNEVITGPVTAEKFVADIAAGWEARVARAAAIDENREKLMSDKEYIEYMVEVISAEYDYINKYRDAEFEEANLEKYFQDYIGALDEQYIAITEYYGQDDKLYQQYWNNGYYNRCRAMYWINRKFGMDIKKENQKNFTDLIALGKCWDMKVTIENDLMSQLTKLDWSVDSESSNAIFFSPITITNNTSYPIAFLRITANFFDKEGNKVSDSVVFSRTDIGAGNNLTDNGCMVLKAFDSISFLCEHHISDYYYGEYQFEVTPNIQYSWNKETVKKWDNVKGQKEDKTVDNEEDSKSSTDNTPTTSVKEETPPANTKADNNSEKIIDKAATNDSDTKTDTDADVEKAFNYVGAILAEKIVQNLYHPRTFKLRIAELWPVEEAGEQAYFMHFEYEAENRVGGKTPNECFVLMWLNDDGSYKYQFYLEDYTGNNADDTLMMNVLAYGINEAEYHRTSIRKNVTDLTNHVLSIAVFFYGC